MRRTIRSAGARLFFLPKYSPDLNPIEQLFAKLKHWLRKAARRTGETVCSAIGEILNTVMPTECKNYFANADMSDLTSSRSSAPSSCGAAPPSKNRMSAVRPCSIASLNLCSF